MNISNKELYDNTCLALENAKNRLEEIMKSLDLSQFTLIADIVRLEQEIKLLNAKKEELEKSEEK